jgi:hypothetical protein
MRSLYILLPTVALLTAALPVHAEWTLENSSSQLSFVTIKATDVAEVDTFTELSGSVGIDGHARVVIELASVDTLIPIRDERMREILFQTDVFPTATAEAQLDLNRLQGLARGASTVVSTELLFSIGDADLPITTDLLVARLADDRMLVATLKPIIVNADAVSLAAGVEQLREIAGLPSISKAVPVSFVLQFVGD